MTDGAPRTETRDVVVVGTGFGGAVAACRLAQGGQRPLVLERGRRYGPGHRPFPRGWGLDCSWELDRGPFDVALGEVVTLRAAGVGGGSLLYSNVHLRMPARGFADGWPAGWTREALDPYYALVEHILEVTPIHESQPLGVAHRTEVLEDAAVATGRGAQSFRPPLAVTFSAPGTAVRNRHGVEQYGCTHCAECNIGCNVGAKNSLDMNYLAVAERDGAELRPDCEVTGLARTPDGGYRVAYTDHGDGSRVHVLATTVVLAAGALGTTALLLDAGDALGPAAAGVGRHYSANGDLVSAGLDVDRPFVPEDGPAIATALLHDEGEHGPWFLVQDGGYPADVAAAVLAALRGVELVELVESWIDRVLAATGGGAHRLYDALVRALTREPGARGPAFAAPSATDRIAILLAMGRDSSDGTVSVPWWWRALPHRLRRTWIEWDVSANVDLYDAEQALCDELVEEGMGGKAVAVPTWRNARLPVSVHSLGGAVMADTVDGGVVDTHGQVFSCPGLYVLDGAAIPHATGVNPSSTIAAVAERNVERLVRLLRDEPDWQAPETRDVDPGHDPMPDTPPGGHNPPRRDAAFVAHATADGTLDGLGATPRALHLRVTLAGADPARTGATARVQGELEIDGLGATGPVRVGRGVVVHTADGLRWTLPFVVARSPYVLAGHSATLHDDVTVTLHRGLSRQRRVVAQGTLSVAVEPDRAPATPRGTLG